MDEQFIPFIHNYCDRWCERCRFITQCRVGAEEIKRIEKGVSLEDIDMSETIAQNLQKALKMLEQFAEEQGIDLNNLSEEMDELLNDEPDYTPQQQELKELGKRYITASESWLSNHYKIFKEKEIELNRNIQLGIPSSRVAAELSNAVEIIQWFLIFINVKIDRAVYGMQQNFDETEDPIQNDANGSAKVALDAIERSLSSWEVIRKHFKDQIDELIDLFLILGKMRTVLLSIFPEAPAFVRPGFDEAEDSSN